MSPAFTKMAYRWACAGLCLAFVYSGLSKAFDFDSALAEQRHFGLSPAPVFALLTIAVQLGGSACILFGRARLAAAGAALLAVFTLLASVIGHPFWRESGGERFNDLNSFLEHFGLIGGFLLIMLIELTDALTQREPKRDPFGSHDPNR